jgi:hypothetical protein
MPTMTTLQYGGLNITSDGQDGTNWLTQLEGWEGTPPTRFDDVQRLNAHGSFTTPVWAAPRVVTATGFSLSDTARDAVFAATGYPMQVPGAAAASTLAVTTVGRSLSAAAQLTRYAPVILTRGFWQVGHFPWVIEWRCTDPLRYGPTIIGGPITMPTSGGGLVFPLFIVAGVITWGTVPAPQIINLANTGNAPTTVILTVSAGGTALTGGFQIVETTTGSVLRYVDDLPAGSTVVFDSATGSVTLNGTADRRGSLTVASWWQIPAGVTRSIILQGLIGSSATATLTASTRPAYW